VPASGETAEYEGMRCQLLASDCTRVPQSMVLAMAARGVSVSVSGVRGVL